jgi:hypothetical protein
MRQLREPDAFPTGDIGLMRAMAGADGVRPTAAVLQARAEAWRPWRAYAALHLWSGEVVADPLAPAKDAYEATPGTPRTEIPHAETPATETPDDRRAA